MNDTLESLRHKIEGATELGSVVRSMKALSASSIHQYEQALLSLESYYHTVQLGLYICLAQSEAWKKPGADKKGKTGAVVFGAGQGLVGQFNDLVVHAAKDFLSEIPGAKTVWAVGEAIATRLEDAGLPPVSRFSVPYSVHSITRLMSRLLFEMEKAIASGEVSTIYLFYNRPRQGGIYAPVNLRFVPLDEVWLKKFSQIQWESGKIPEAVFGPDRTLPYLVQEYLFVTLFRTCAESLASENAGRLAAMQRAEKNIQELLEDLNLAYHQLRQNSIDEELFDVVAGSEALNGNGAH
jgi:F-type H+-transporting ATPase subunit gamma